MTSTELGKLTREMNKKYRDMFGYTPCIANYIANSSEYVDALTKAIEENKELSYYLQERKERGI